MMMRMRMIIKRRMRRTAMALFCAPMARVALSCSAEAPRRIQFARSVISVSLRSLTSSQLPYDCMMLIRLESPDSLVDAL